jgi:BlaI family penicillinase repressor
MAGRKREGLSRRERQIMDIVYAAGEATAAEVHERMADAPSYSAVRALLRVLVEKGHLKHRRDGRRYVFRPTVARTRARRSALERLLATFFDDSVEAAVATMLDLRGRELDDDELDRIEALIQEAREGGEG